MKPQDLPAGLAPVFERQRAAWADEPYPAWEVRADRLRRLRRLLESREAELAGALDADFGGRPAVETQLLEVWPRLEEVKSALRHGPRWMRPRRAGVAKWFMPARAFVLPQPLGVVGIIVPLNYPLYLAVGPMVAALAAGNRVMVKLPEATPAFSALLQRLFADTFADDEVCLCTGGPEVAAQFSALPFDHLVFCWFDRDEPRIRRALKTLPAGGVTVNDTLLHIAQDTLPFGGVGASGMGHYHGRWGFDTMSKLKPVFRQSRLNAMTLFLPPYSAGMRRLLRLMKQH